VIGKSTPRFAKMLSWKYANMSGDQTRQDLLQHNGIKVSKKLIQAVNERVGSILSEKEQKWTYEIPALGDEVHTISLSRDGTTCPIKGEGHKETMSGTISLYDQAGERLHTIYTGCAPEHGKATFDYVWGQEIDRIQCKYPNETYVGIADGEKGNWRFLTQHVPVQIIDFWHATEYLSGYAKSVYKDTDRREEWLTRSRSDLKNKRGGAAKLLKEMKQYARDHFIEGKEHPVIRAVTYFTNHKSKMNYWKYQRDNLPIGSGVVEAACKVLVKQRFCRSGSRWTRNTVDNILLARSLILTNGRWPQFWSKLDRYGF
jgi:hypothetical protein